MSYANIAVLLSCHGTVEHEDDIAAFITNIRRGRPTPQHVVDEVTERFRAVGGSPLMRISHQQAAALEGLLGVPVKAAARLWDPYPKAVLAELAAAGITTVVSLPLAPQSTHIYNQVVAEAGAELGLTIVQAASWGTEPLLISAFTDAIFEAHQQLTLGDPAELAIILSAHSLPRMVLDRGDPYEKDFRAMADAVAEGLAMHGLDVHPQRVAFQSQGMGGGDWLGPDLLHTFGELQDLGVKKLLMAPIGFLAEHIETLYDIDIEARQLADKMGFEEYVRMPPMNTRDDFMAALEAVARPLLAQTGS